MEPLTTEDSARPDRWLRRLQLAVPLVLVVGLLVACVDDDAEPAVTATDAWALATPGGTTVGAVYVTLRATVDDALDAVGVSSDVAAAAELHLTMPAGDSDMSSMEHADEMALPAGDDVALDPGDSHIMLVDLATPLEAGDTFELTLGFEHAPDVAVTVEVLDGPPA